MSRGFKCPITDEACENGSCTRSHCADDATQEHRAEAERVDFEAGITIDQLTLLDPDPRKPVEGYDRHGRQVYYNPVTGRWRFRSDRKSN